MSSLPGWCSRSESRGLRRMPISPKLVDFCEFYGREMLRLAEPQPLIHNEAEENELVTSRWESE